MNDKNVKQIKEKVLEELDADMKEVRKDKDVVIFASEGEISDMILKKSRTIDARKFRLHLFNFFWPV